MIVWIIAAVAVLFIVLVFVTGYVKASPDTAYIISGLRKTPKVLIGKAGVKIPFFEKKDELSLQLIPIDVKTSSAVPTADYINIKVDAAVNVKISDTPDLLNLAAQNFLNRKVDYIASVAREVLEGNMREIVGSVGLKEMVQDRQGVAKKIVGKMELQEMVSDRQKFANLVKENAEPDLAAMGLDIVSFNVQNFVDDSAVIENLGVDNIVKIQKNAAISRAVSEKEIAKARAIAQKEANDAEVAAAQEIARQLAGAGTIAEASVPQAEDFLWSELGGERRYQGDLNVWFSNQFSMQEDIPRYVPKNAADLRYFLHPGDIESVPRETIVGSGLDKDPVTYNDVFTCNLGYYRVENPDAPEAASVLILKDSFQNATIDYLSAIFRSVTVVDPRSYQETPDLASLLDADGIDLVLFFYHQNNVSRELIDFLSA